jgi:hypothetical protein
MGDGLINQSAATDFSIAAIMARTVVAQQQRNAAAAAAMGMVISTASSEYIAIRFLYRSCLLVIRRAVQTRPRHRARRGP